MMKRLFGSISDLWRPVLSDRSILKYNAKGLLIEQPIDKDQLQPNSVDLRLGNTWKTLQHNDYIVERSALQNSVSTFVINPRKKALYYEGIFKKDEEGREYYILKPGQFCLMASKEILNIPNGILSFVQGRSSVARLAIQTEQAGLIDAGFRGTITFEVFNQSEFPIILYTGMRVAQVYFFKAERADMIYGSTGKGSKYYNQIQATGSRIDMDPELK